MNVPTSGKILIGVVVLVVATGVAFANFAGTDVFIPSLGRGSGASNSQWNACIWVHNPNATAVNVTFRLLLRDQPNPSPQVFNDTIPAGDTRRYDDAFATLFGVTTKTFGAVRVTTLAGQPVIVNARSYSTPAGGDQMDTTGQFYAAIPASFAIGPTQKTQLLGVYQTTPQASSEFRYNYGFVETTGNQVTLQVTALDPNGTSVGSTSYTLGGYEARQYNITDLLPTVNATNLRLEVAVTSGPGQVVAFGSGIANRSNDPSTFEMSFRDELLAASNPSGLTSVAHDGTLQGDGTTTTPLGIANSGVGNAQLANGAISPAKLSASGSTNGQVLTSSGSAVSWQNAGLTLPYNGSASTAVGTDVFSLTNTGAGRAVSLWTTSDTALWANSTNGHAVDARSSSNSAVTATSSTGNGISATSTSANGVLAGSTGGNGVNASSTNGNGVLATSTNGNGVNASSSTSGNGVLASSTSGNGVLARSTSGNGVVATSTSANGVVATSTSGNGVLASGANGINATSTDGNGVLATSTNGNGVLATSTTGNGINVSSTSGNALVARSTAGNGLLVSSTSGNVILGQGGSPTGLINVFLVDVAGEVYAHGAFHTNGLDVAESIPTDATLQPGDVVEIDPLQSGKFRLAATPNSTTVAGVISTHPGVSMNANDAVADTPPEGPQLALVGRVPVKVSAENGVIRPGDLLVASATPGHAMRASANPAAGTVIGKALGSLDSRTGVVEMLVMLR